MLEKEHFVDTKATIEDSGAILGSGLNVPENARRLLDKAPVDEEGQRAFHVRQGNRYYRISGASTDGGITIEGFVGWHHERYQRSPYLYPERMIPVRVESNGGIHSHGQWVSPHDERLGVLSRDLILGRPVSEEIYRWEESRINEHS